MNDQEQPEDGTNPSPTAGGQAPTAQVILPMGDFVGESADDVLDDEQLEGDDLTDDDDNDADDLAEDDDLEEERVRSLVEELFDEDDLGEVMSELDVLTLEDAAAYLKVEYGMIRRLIKEQALPGRKVGDEWRFLRGALADWLCAPGGVAVPVAPAQAPTPARVEVPVQSERREFTAKPPFTAKPQFTAKPPLSERFSQGNDEGQQQRYPQQGGSRYPQQGGSRYPQQGGGQPPQQGGARYPQQESRPPRRPQNEGGGNQGGNQGGGYQSRGYQGGGGQSAGNQGGGYQGGGGQGGGGQGPGGYPPPRRPRFGNDQDQQQPPQGEYRPPRKPYAGGQGNFGGQSGGQTGGNFSGGPGPGSAGGQKYNGGPKKPKRKSLNEQRFKRLDRRKEGDDSGQAEPQDSNE